MNCHCEECNGITYHAQGSVEDKQGIVYATLECEECETRHILR